MKIARVLLTEKCQRSCTYCCNHYSSIMKNAIYIPDLRGLEEYNQILITGGEVLLDADTTIAALKEVRQRYPNTTLYLYSALFTKRMIEIVELVDGIHFTLHAASTEKDVARFNSFQELAKDYPDKSFRLYLYPEIKLPITVYPYIWTRLEVKPWIPEEDLSLPPNETLYIIDSQI